MWRGDSEISDFGRAMGAVWGAGADRPSVNRAGSIAIRGPAGGIGSRKCLE